VYLTSNLENVLIDLNLHNTIVGRVQTNELTALSELQKQLNKTVLRQQLNYSNKFRTSVNCSKCAFAKITRHCFMPRREGIINGM